MSPEVLPPPALPRHAEGIPPPPTVIRAAPRSDRLAARRARLRLLAFAATGIGLIPWLAYSTFYAEAIDAQAYFLAQPGDLYGAQMGTENAYLYSPAFSQVIEPLRWLGWDAFRTIWRLLEAGALALMAGPLTGPLIFVHPVSLEFNMGNIHLPMALAVVAGFRYPAAWAFILLTKVTPGVGLLWFAVRREWRRLGITLGVTAGIAGVSFLLAPGDWLAWLAYLTAPQPPHDGFVFVSAPLWLRLVAAGGLVSWGARSDRRWTVLVAAFLALPSAWETGLAMLVGLWALRETRREPVGVMTNV